MRAAREERQHPLMLCWELGQIWKGAVGQETAGTCPISSDGEKLGESRQRGRGHIWEVVLHSVLSQTEPGWRGSSDCPHVGSILVVLAMAGVAAYILLLLWEPGVLQRDILPGAVNGSEPKD